MKILLFLIVISQSLVFGAPTQECPSSDTAVTTPAPVHEKAIVESVLALKSLPNLTLATIASDQLHKDISSTFNTSLIKTKMEQFYTLLFLISKHLEPTAGKEYLLDPKGVSDILLKSGVFSSPDVPTQITSVALDLNNKKKPIYRIEFAKPGIEIALNQGKGFFVFKSGKCQHATHLIFDKFFSVMIKTNSKSNVVASDFKGVNLVGDFGNRGIVDVDINYVALKSVEFYKGTQNGKVTAYVSDEEFKKNKHSNLLRIVSKFVPDRSVQPIDW